MIQVSIFEIENELFCIHLNELYSERFYNKSFLSENMEWITQYVGNLQNFAQKMGFSIAITKQTRRIA